MNSYPPSAIERAMKIQEVIIRAISGKILWMEAAQIIGVSCRTMRRWRQRYQERGYDGLFDRRRRQPGPRRVPVAVVRQVLQLYEQKYSDFNVRHFHEKLRGEHGIGLSYQWVKTALQAAGLVARRCKRGPHRLRRERRPLSGMMIHCDGSPHCWVPALAPGRQDLIVFLDDATSEVYEAYLVKEEGTLTVMQGLKRLLQRKGLFCSLYTDRGSHFFNTPEAGGAVNRTNLTQIGRALQQLGIEHIPSYSPQARGRMERLFGTWQGRLPQELRCAGIQTVESANQYIRQVFQPWHNRNLRVKAREPGHAFIPCGSADLDAIVCVQHDRVVAQDNSICFGNRSLQIPPSKWRCNFAQCRVKLCEHLDGTLSIRFGPHRIAEYRPKANDYQLVQKLRQAA